MTHRALVRGAHACALVLALASNAFLGADAYPQFRDRIPNAYNVRDSSGNLWPGVGHKNPGGGSWRNVFGQDFFAAGKTWTKELCEKDSDCDGLSNGYELGDPDCTWRKLSDETLDAPSTFSQPDNDTPPPPSIHPTNSPFHHYRAWADTRSIDRHHAPWLRDGQDRNRRPPGGLRQLHDKHGQVQGAWS